MIYHSDRAQMVETLNEIRRVLRPGGLFYATLNSTRNNHFGEGTEIEPCTFSNPKKADGEHLHHYSDENDVRNLLSSWTIESLKEFEVSLSGGLFPDSWHWSILARNAPPVEGA